MIADKELRFVSGHRACAGCGIPQIVRTILAATDKRVVVSNATGCLEVTSTIYPYSAWKTPYIHNAFENASATTSGIECAYKALKEKGKITEEMKFVTFGGDGGTYDIGLQSLSGAFERGHDFLYILYDNEAYMNTGIQRSSATPFGANTTTTPVGDAHKGKELFKKKITQIAIAHDIPYVAQASLSDLNDLLMKAKKAFEIKGPKFINVLQPCTLGWKFPTNMTVEIAKLAVKTRFWPLYEFINDKAQGEYKINHKPKENIPVEEFLKTQGRFKHMFKEENKWMIQKVQEHVDIEWEGLLQKEKCSQKS